MATDALYWQTVLNLNFNGDLTDISPTVKTLTANGGMAAGTAQLKIGSGSLTATAASSQYLSHAQHADFDFGSGNFCIEFYWRPTAANVDYSLLAYALGTVSTTADMCVIIDHLGTTSVGGGTGKVRCIVASGTTQHTVYTNAALLAATWYHIAVVRNGTTLTLYLDGVAQTQQAVIGTDSVNTVSSRQLRIARYDSAVPRYANGYYDRLLITKGAARYTANFTPSLLDLVTEPVGTGDADLTGPIGTLLAAGGGSAPLSAPMGTLIALAAGAAHLTAPMGTLEAVGHDSTGERSFAGTAPMGTLQALGGAKATMSAPMGTLIASVSVPISVTAQLVGPMGTVLASGTVGVSMTADLRLSSAGTIEAYSGGQATLEAPMGLLGAVAAVGVLAHFAGNAPMGRLVASGTAGIVMRAELTAPMIEPTPSGRATLVAPMGFLTAVGRAVITTTYEAYVVNLQPGERMPHQVTRYDDAWDFDHVIRWRNRYYGVKATGMYLLGADLDGADPIAWTLKTGMSKMGSNQKKTCREGIVYGRVGAGLTGSVTIRGDDTTRKSYDAIVQADEVAEATRIKYGRGIKAVYWSFGLADPDGGPADIDSLQFDAAELSRKVF